MAIDLKYFIPTIIVNILIIIIGFYLFFLFVKSKSFHTYPCYNMIIFSLILLLDNIFRIIPLKDSEENHKTFYEYIVAFILVFFDKMILATLTMHMLVFYLGAAKTKFYFDHERAIFLVPFIINVTVCFIITLVYILVNDIRQPQNKLYHYCGDSDGKKYTDIVFNSVYFCVNLFSSINLVIFICKRKKDAESGLIEDLDYKRNSIRIIVLFLLNVATFLESYLIVFNKLRHVKADLIYLTTCLLIDLYNSLNRIVYFETIKIFCKNKYEKYAKENDLNKLLDDDEGGRSDSTELKRQRSESF